jgi:sec-independent protein translocase protein TatB
MFDFGFWEISIIAIITLIVVGPDKMPALARKAGLYVGKFNKFVRKIKTDINDELQVDELKEQLSIKDEKSTLSQVLGDVKTSVDKYKQEIKKSPESTPQTKDDLKENRVAEKNEKENIIEAKFEATDDTVTVIDDGIEIATEHSRDLRD